MPAVLYLPLIQHSLVSAPSIIQSNISLILAPNPSCPRLSTYYHHGSSLPIIYVLRLSPRKHCYARLPRLLLTSTDAIFTRLYSQRSSSPSGSDSLLKHRFASRSGRLIYSLCGPGLLSNCVWCHVDVPETFLFLCAPEHPLSTPSPHCCPWPCPTKQVFRSDNKAGAVWQT